MGMVPYQRDNQFMEHLGMTRKPGPMEQSFDCRDAFTELAILLPTRQLEALEQMASTLGLTTGHLLRRLIRNWLGGLHDVPVPKESFLGLNAGTELASKINLVGKPKRLRKTN